MTRNLGAVASTSRAISGQHRGMDIIRIEERPTTRGPAEYFTGVVWMDQIVATPTPPSRTRALKVSFEPGARTAWHTHPRGQVLHILSGVGRVQCAGGPVLTVKPGDTVLFKPDERHWHGAAPGHAMTHLAMQETDDTGSAVTWLEKVTDAEYGAA
jgi:quercetin dioxygenase-like cupin family protein